MNELLGVRLYGGAAVKRGARRKMVRWSDSYLSKGVMNCSQRGEERNSGGRTDKIKLIQSSKS